ncbi:unnamed protein product [Ceratitis capitata]|uniref:(Mediterranean fruit fly) hypothetical protein n=1 Tax=Ceratitis capitata TaxID=7213 RepID=A0A811U1H1_CERCA|nr:unnamed protein product [Ceratitis capitata]
MRLWFYDRRLHLSNFSEGCFYSYTLNAYLSLGISKCTDVTFIQTVSIDLTYHEYKIIELTTKMVQSA